ncbi:hypothetical protein [Clostridium tyrobutyricum]|nr:hypothetical protein [Clostridium tyrobutyricum]MBV4428393.1 hypothetical protein [Clostridium tyrobutyricum]
MCNTWLNCIKCCSEGNKIFFDYKIKQGKSITTNAKYLMKKVGIKILEE